MSPAKTAQPIEMPFGMWTRVGPKEALLDGGAHWRNLANTIGPSVCGGDVALCQITVIACCYFVRRRITMASIQWSGLLCLLV